MYAIICTFRTFMIKIPVLHISQFKESTSLSEVYVNTVTDHIQLDNPLIAKPHSHNFYLCVMFTQGSGVHEIDFNSYEIKPGTVFFLRPGQTHFWKYDTSPKGYIFFHSQEFYEIQFLEHRIHSFPFFYTYQNPPVLRINSKVMGRLNQMFEEAYTEYNQTAVMRELKLTSIITGIYIEFTRLYSSSEPLENFHSSHYSKILANLNRLIDTHFYREKLPKFYAGELNITTKHLNRVVKSTINKTTGQLISDRIVLESKRLIVHKNVNMAEIADTLGFSDYAYFSRFFKSKTGVTPMEFRKSYM